MEISHSKWMNKTKVSNEIWMKNVSHLGTVQENVIIGGHMTHYISCYNKKSEIQVWHHQSKEGGTSDWWFVTIINRNSWRQCLWVMADHYLANSRVQEWLTAGRQWTVSCGVFLPCLRAESCPQLPINCKPCSCVHAGRTGGDTARQNIASKVPLGVKTTTG